MYRIIEITVLIMSKVTSIGTPILIACLILFCLGLIIENIWKTENILGRIGEGMKAYSSFAFFTIALIYVIIMGIAITILLFCLIKTFGFS